VAQRSHHPDWVKIAGVDLRASPCRKRHPAPGSIDLAIARTGVASPHGDTSTNCHRIYQLNKVCSADIPGRGEFFSYMEYSQRRFAGLGFRPDGQVLLLDGDAMVGLCALSFAPECDWAFIEMTAILRP
jgi:hypothetical protein